MGGIKHQNMGGVLLLYIYVTLIRCVAAYVQVNHRHFWVGKLLISGHPINQQRRLCDVPSILKATNQQIVTSHVCLGIYILYIGVYLKIEYCTYSQYLFPNVQTNTYDGRIPKRLQSQQFPKGNPGSRHALPLGHSPEWFERRYRIDLSRSYHIHSYPILSYPILAYAIGLSIDPLTYNNTIHHYIIFHS